jgi:hypothetical protein
MFKEKLLTLVEIIGSFTVRERFSPSTYIGTECAEGDDRRIDGVSVHAHHVFFVVPLAKRIVTIKNELAKLEKIFRGFYCTC